MISNKNVIAGGALAPAAIYCKKPEALLPAFCCSAGLQVQDSVLDLLGSALVPELGANVTAGAAGNIHLVLVGVAAVGALPDELALLFHDFDFTVETAFLAVVGLGVSSA